MTLPETGKLVRDLIPAIIQNSGKVPITMELATTDLCAALKRKAIEEVGELCEAEHEDLLEEIADVYEVLLSIAQTQGVDWSSIEKIAEAKRFERGGFMNAIWLLETPQ